MVDNVIQMAGWKPRHRAAAVLPVICYNAWVDYCNAVTRAWLNVLFHPRG